MVDARARLEGRAVLVTGAARPRGIGRGIVARLLAAGARVALTDLDDDTTGSDLYGAVASLGVDDDHLIAVPLDVTDRTRVDDVVGQVVDHFGELYGLVNNAGTPAGAGSVLDTEAHRWDLSWDVNVMGMVHCLQSAAPHLASARGAVVNTASIAGLGAVPGLAAYTTTKHAVVGFTKAAAADLAPLGIRVNAVCPGLIDTQMGDAEVQHLAALWEVGVDQARERLVGDVPLGRWGTSADVAEVVAFLLDPVSNYLTGVAMPVAGGLGPGL